ncbi:MAG: alpha/beta hydrolase, partial [Salinibacterium amurskyense]
MNSIAAAPASRARRLALVVPALALTLLLSGCVNLLNNFLGERSQPTGETVSAELAPYYEQILTWVDCGDGAQCATAIAPMDWANPSPETDIEIVMARHEATGESLGSLFVNPGGPGASGFDLIHDDVDFAVSSNLRENYDVIGWDPRGVGRSTPVTCLDDDGLDEFIFGIPEAAVGSDEWLATSEQAAIDFGQACL